MAERKESLPSPTNSSDSNDQDFAVTAEMMIDAADYEGTIDEEEDMDDEEDDDELADLQKEGDIPIEELLAMYYNDPNGENDIETKPDGKSDATQSLSGVGVVDENYNQSSDDGQSNPLNPEETDPFQNQRITRGLAALNSQYFVEDDYSSDEDYQPGVAADDWKKEIQIGDDYQAEVDEGLSPYPSHQKTLDFDDKLLWTPNVVTSEQLSSYLNLVYKLTEFGSQHSNRDDEQALFTLLQTKDVTTALKKRQDQEKKPPDVSLWSEDECQNFEQGLRVFGKDFRLIQKNKLTSRSVGEIVQFYYLWKKTERHDAFVTQTKLGRKKYTLPGIADMMGRFIEENDSIFSNRSSSPSSNSADPHNMYSTKSQQVKKEPNDYINNTTDTRLEAINDANSDTSSSDNLLEKTRFKENNDTTNYKNTSNGKPRNLDRLNSTSVSDDNWRPSTVTTSLPIGMTN